MQQTAQDLGITLHMKLQDDNYTSQQMAEDIRNLVRFEFDDSEHGHNHNVPQIDGLIVTIPDDIVKEAVEEVVYAGIHVFGFNLGYDILREDNKDHHLIGYVAQDEFMAGALAAEEFATRRLAELGPPQTAIFVNHNRNDPALTKRFEGFNFTLYQMYGIVADHLIVDPAEFYETILNVDNAIEACKYDFVLLGGAETVSAVTAAYDHHLCDAYFREEDEESVMLGLYANVTELLNLNLEIRRPMVIGAFDATHEILDAIAVKHIEFTLVNQKHIQSALPVLLSTIYASTGQKLNLPHDGEIYMSGPQVVDIDNMPSDSFIGCALEAFPICPRNGEPLQTICPCIDRSQQSFMA